jgi:hypothetical protein
MNSFKEEAGIAFLSVVVLVFGSYSFFHLPVGNQALLSQAVAPSSQLVAYYPDQISDVVSVPSLAFSGSEFSVSFWFNVTKNSGLFGWGQNKFCVLTGAAAQVVCTVDGDTSGGAHNTSTSFSSWHHIVYTSTASSQSLYVDGSLAGSSSETLRTDGGTFILGNRLGGSSILGGLMKEVRVYSRALTSSEASDLFVLGGGTGAAPAQNPPLSNPPVSNPPVSNPPTTTTTCTANARYVDANVGVSGDGCSWATAWKNFSNINWPTIQPGTTIWISGGDYREDVAIGKGGTSGNPIIIKASQESGHNSPITLHGGITLGGNNWVTIDGAKSDSYTSTIGDNTFNVPLVKNNINFVIDAAATDNTGVNMGSGDLITGITLKWLDISTSDNVEKYGVRFNPSSATGGLSGNEVAYNWIHHTGQDAVYVAQNHNEVPNVLVVHHNLIQDVGDDGMEVGAGTTAHHNIFDTSRALHGHPDGIQSTGSHIHVYDNIFKGFWLSSFMRTQGWDATYSGIQIYGNLFAPSGAMSPQNPVELVWYGDKQPWNTRDVSHWKDWVIANNTFADVGAANGIFMGPTRDWLGNAYYENIRMENNLFLNIAPQGAFKIAASQDPNDPAHCCVFVTEADTIVDYNVIAKTSTLLRGPAPANYNGVGTTAFIYNDVFYPNAEAMSAATRYKNNRSTAPTLANMAAYDYRPTSADTVIRDRGTDLSSLGLPDMNKDLMGNIRGQYGPWDIGAFEYPGTGSAVPPIDPVSPDPVAGLVAQWNFDTDAFSGQIFKDTTGTNNATCQSALALNGTTYNQCPLQTTGPDSTKAAQFSGAASLGLCDNAADYLGVSRNASLGSLPRGTVSLWVASGSNGSDALSYRILDTLSPAPHTWQLHRDGELNYSLTVNSNTGAETDVLSFPGVSIAPGTWTLYTFTWDGSAFKGYINGTYFGQTSMSGFSSLDLSTYLAIGALMHGDTRNASDGGNCVNQYLPKNQTNQGSYVFPNAGFFQGKLDDIRIYDRALSASEVAALAGNSVSANIVSVAKSGTGNGTVTGSGISCGKHCAEMYPAGTTVMLSATPTADSAFAGWTGSCGGTGSCSVTASGAKTVGAVFTKVYATVATLPAKNGTNSSTDPFLIASDGSIYQHPQAASLTASAKMTYTFSVSDPGDYVIVGSVNASSQANNSLYINVDADPDSTMVWYIAPTAGFEERFASWGGSDTGSGTIPKTFTLAAGQHTIVVRGREDLTYLASLIVEKKGSASQISLVGDFNKDGVVNSIDLSLLTSAWNQNNATYDLNKDGTINTLDYAIMVRNWSI